MRTTSVKHKDIFNISREIIFSQDNSYNIIIPNAVNNINLYDMGFSKTIGEHYPSTKINYQLLGKNFLAKNPGYVQFVDVDRNAAKNKRLIVATMVVQNGLSTKKNKRTLNYAYLVKSMANIKKFILTNFNSENRVAINLHKNTFKHSGGNWTFINYLINDVWNGIEINYF